MDTTGRSRPAGRSPLATALALLALLIQLLTPLALAVPPAGDAFAASLVICGAHGVPPVRPGDDGKTAPLTHDCQLCCARLSVASLPPATAAVSVVVRWDRITALRPSPQIPRAAAGISASSPRGPPAV